VQRDGRRGQGAVDYRREELLARVTRRKVMNIIYFYTIDKDKEIGSELRLRGHLNLTDVGKEVLKPTVARP
jgi:hypothetical protein